MKKNSKSLILLGIAITLLLGLLGYRSSYTKKPIWGAVYQKSYSAVDFKNATKTAQTCTSEENVNKCDITRNEMMEKFVDATFYNGGYQFCLKKFGKTAEDCRKLVDNVSLDEDMNHIAPSKRE